MHERQRIGIRDIPNATVGKISGEFLMHGVGIEVADPDDNLAVVEEHLKTGSVVTIFNHAENDFFIWTKFIEDYITSLDNVRALIAMKYLDPERGRSSRAFSLFFPKWKTAYGLDVWPIVQRKDWNIYPDYRRINSASVLNARKFLQTAGHVLAFTPEGTRSLTGELGKAEEGTELILRLSNNAVILPLAAEFPVGSALKLYRNKNPLRIRVGKPFTYTEIKRDSEQTDKNIPELAMRKIAILLPEQNRGSYQMSI